MPPLSPLAAARQVTVAAQAAEGDNDAADLPRVRFVAVERKRAMPIRFRCAYCNQLMGIARRKAGTVVSCPMCHGQVVVPTPQTPAEADDEPGGNVFERQDFDAGMLNPQPA